MQTELSKAKRKLAKKIKEINRLKHQINKDTDINGSPNIIDVRIDVMRINGNDECFINDFVDFKKFVTLEFQNINQKIANLNVKDHYPLGNTLNNKKNGTKQIIVQNI